MLYDKYVISKKNKKKKNPLLKKNNTSKIKWEFYLLLGIQNLLTLQPTTIL